MWCPKCAEKTQVIGTVTTTSTTRFRRCLSCNYTFSTIELIRNSENLTEYIKETLPDELIKIQNNIKANQYKN